MRTYQHIGIQVPQVYLPRTGIDLTKWSVVACDQFTSEPEYWEQVKRIVGDSPSTFHLILPEIYLGKPEEQERTQRVQLSMQEYLENGLLEPYEGFMYVERQVAGKTRKGLLLCLDLEQYDYNKGSQSLIRATEGTIVDRLPPRVRIREKAPLELPHILVLIDDPDRTVIEPLAKLASDKLVKRYDFDLMLDSGHLKGYQVSDPQVEAGIIDALSALAEPATFRRKYALDAKEKVFLFAMGDGNHSLATAKTIWDRVKPLVGMDHPARYALVEVENVHDEGLEFEPIHRVLFNLKQDLLAAMQAYYGANLNFIPASGLNNMLDRLSSASSGAQSFGFVAAGQSTVIEIQHPATNLAVGTLQAFLDDFLKAGGAEKIDYVHGAEVVARLGSQPSNAGFYLPPMDKYELFKTVILDGALPRKTFSMGEAKEKRFYMESRRITKPD